MDRAKDRNSVAAVRGPYGSSSDCIAPNIRLQGEMEIIFIEPLQRAAHREKCAADPCLRFPWRSRIFCDKSVHDSCVIH